MYYKNLIAKIIFLLPFSFYSQDEFEEPTFYKEIKPKHSYTIDFALPVCLANKPFKATMQGFLRTSASYQFSLKNNFYAGFGGNFTYFQINRFKITPQMTGGLQVINSYLKFGFEKFYSERIGFDLGVKTGGAFLVFKSDSLITPKKSLVSIIEPYFSFCLTGNEKTAYKWTLSYSCLGFGFDPKQFGSNTVGGFKESEFSTITQFLSFGFSFSHYFKQWD